MSILISPTNENPPTSADALAYLMSVQDANAYVVGFLNPTDLATYQAFLAARSAGATCVPQSS